MQFPEKTKEYIYLTDEKMEHRKAAFLKDCEETTLGLLWEILFETDIRDTSVLKERIYHFGSVFITYYPIKTKM